MMLVVSGGNTVTEVLANLSDAELIQAARTGGNAAFGALWARHAAAVRAAARSFTGFDADDVTAEAFARVLKQVRAGGGPDLAVRAYLVRAAKNVAIDMSRNRANASQLELVEDELVTHASPDHAERVLEDLAAAAAFQTLSEREQAALWYRVVEELPVQDCAKYLGVTENAMSVIVRRARKRFADAWICESVERHRDLSPECEWALNRAPKYARGALTSGQRRRIDRHLAGCPPCGGCLTQAKRVSSHLALILVPALIGIPARAYLGRDVAGLAASQASAASVSGTPAVTTPTVWGATTAPTLTAGVTATALVAGSAAVAVAVALVLPAALGLTASSDSVGEAHPEISGEAPSDATPKAAAEEDEAALVDRVEEDGDDFDFDLAGSEMSTPRSMIDAPVPLRPTPPSEGAPQASDPPDPSDQAGQSTEPESPDDPVSPNNPEPPEQPSEADPPATPWTQRNLTVQADNLNLPTRLPQLSGLATSGATVMILSTDHRGELVWAFIIAQQDGSWAWQLDRVLDGLVLVFQYYQAPEGINLEPVEKFAVLLSFLEREVLVGVDDDAGRTVFGYTGGTPGGLLALESTHTDPLLNRTVTLDATGSAEFVVSDFSANIAAVTYWQVQPDQERTPKIWRAGTRLGG